MKIRAMVTITGLVQGVGFRHHTRQAALRFNVAGWVRNLPDGSVQGCFEGEETAVDALICWCRTGPSWARVEEVAVTREPYRGEFDDFEITR